MTFDVVITAIQNPRAKPVIARYLAHDPAVSLQKATALLETLPVTYARSLSEADARADLFRLRKIGVTARIVQSVQTEAAQTTPPAPVTEPVSNKEPNLTTKPSLPHPLRTPVIPVERPEFSAIGTQEISAPSKNDNRRGTYVLAGLLLLIVVAGLLSLSAHSRYGTARKAAKAAVLTRDSQTRSAPLRSGSRAGERTGQEMFRTEGGQSQPVHREKSMAYVDSARHLTDIIDAIRFYKLAISFNEQNLDAWMGLLDAYTRQGMTREAQQTRKRMEEIFGSGVFTLQQIVSRFGRPRELSRATDGVVRIEYETKGRSRDELIDETYRLLRALVRSCDCTAISLHARTPSSGGLVVYLETDNFPGSIREYQAVAAITVL